VSGMRHTPATTPVRHVPVEITTFGRQRGEYICAVCGYRWDGELLPDPDVRRVQDEP
jgi:hypothetical protein